MDELARIQRWMQHVITDARGVAAAIESGEARRSLDISREDLEQVISRSRTLTSVQRLEIYANAYYARLVECLAAEFPAVRTAVGEDAFAGLVFGFLQMHPSVSYTLGDLGAAFPDFLARTRPPHGETVPDWFDFLIDLAALERTYSDVFDGPGEEGTLVLQAEDLLNIPPHRWGDLRLKTSASFKLLSLRFPVHEYATSVRRRDEVAIPAPSATWLAVNRRDYVVRRRPLEWRQFTLLQSIQAGRPLGIAMETAFADVGEFDPETPERVRTWFQTWTREGYFVGAAL